MSPSARPPMVSLVVPIYCDEAGLPALLEALAALAAVLGPAFEAVLVVDGSPDRCYPALRDALAGCPFDSQLLALSRNFGAFAAVRAGLARGRGDIFAVMAADLQEPPELVIGMCALLRADAADVVVGRRTARDDPWLTRACAAVFWRLYRALVVPDVAPGGVDIFACSRTFRDELLALREQRSSLVAQVYWLGFRRATVPYARRPRRQGRSTWCWRKRLGYLADSTFAFTDLPIRLLGALGAITAIGAALLGTALALAQALQLVAVPAYVAVILAVTFFGGCNCLGLGLVGAYAWRADENSKGRPLHVTRHHHSFRAARRAA